MDYMHAFQKQTGLITKYGESVAHMLWCMGMYLDYPNLDELHALAYTDKGDDKKIDFLFVDTTAHRIVICQAYYAEKGGKYKASSNKAADLNTAAAWFCSGNLEQVPEKLAELVLSSRDIIDAGDIERIELIYLHNCPESHECDEELNTAAKHLKPRFEAQEVDVIGVQIGYQKMQGIFSSKQKSILISKDISFDGIIYDVVEGTSWKTAIGAASGMWLCRLYAEHKETLFSANYRGFLGVSRRQKINMGIRNTIEKSPENFFVYNNGITILTEKIMMDEDAITLKGISIINGAQTTGSIGNAGLISYNGEITNQLHWENSEHLEKMNVLCRIIEAEDQETIANIVKFNNTQNNITTWDQYSNNDEQLRIEKEFKMLGYVYSVKRGFENISSDIGIEVVAQPLVSFHGDFRASNKGKNNVFDTKSVYSDAFDKSKASHILLAYTLSKAIDKLKVSLNEKESLIDIEEQQQRYLKNLKAKHFTIAVIAKCLDIITGKTIDLKKVEFNYNASLAKNFGIDKLTEKWVPIVRMIIPTIALSITGDLNEFLKTETALTDIKKEVEKTLHALLSIHGNQDCKEFAAMLETKSN